MQDENINKILGELIRETRQKRGMKQTDLADSMGIDFQALSAYERGKRNPGLTWLFRVCDCLDVDFKEFMGELNERRLAD